MSGRLQGFLQAGGADERGGAVELVGFAHFIGDGDEALGGDFLFNQRHREELLQRFQRDGLLAAGVKNRCGGNRAVGVDVVPKAGNLVFVQVKAFLDVLVSHGHFSSFME